MHVPLPNSGPSQPSPVYLGVLGGVAAGTVAWQYGVPSLAASYPSVTWTLPLIAVGIYAWAKRWWAAVLLQVATIGALLSSGTGLVDVLSPAWYSWLSLGTVVATALGGVPYEIATRQWRQRLETLARDPDTGLMRPWLFNWYLEKAVASAKRGKTLSLVYFGFQVYDRSHRSTNEEDTNDLLHELGALLRETSRNEDFLARTDNQQFAALLYGEDEDGAAAYAERIRRQIEFTDSLSEVGCTASAGVAEFDPEAFNTPEEFSRAADRALGSATYAGGNRVIAFGAKAFRQGGASRSEETGPG